MEGMTTALETMKENRDLALEEVDSYEHHLAQLAITAERYRVTRDEAQKTADAYSIAIKALEKTEETDRG